MATVADLINRIERDWLFPAGSKPATGRLNANIDNAVTSLVYTAGYLTQTEVDSIGAGTILEINQEYFRVVTHTPDTRTCTVATRGTVEGTSAAAHVAGDEIYLQKKPGRVAIFEAVADAVVNLYPDFFVVTTTQHDSSNSLISVAATVEDIIHYRYKSTETESTLTRYVEGKVELLENVHTDISDTGKAIQTHGIPASRTGYLTYKGSFARPAAETYDLDTSGVTTEWQQLIILDAVMMLVAGRDIDDDAVNMLTDALAQQVNPTGEGESVSRMLLRLYEYKRSRALRRMYANHPMVVEMNQISG